MKKMLFLLAVAMIVIASCSKNDDPFNEPPNSKEDSVVFIVTSTIVTPIRPEYEVQKNLITLVSFAWAEQVDFTPGSRKVFRGEAAKTIIGSKMMVSPWVVVHIPDTQTSYGRNMDILWTPRLDWIVIEKNKTYTYHFDVTLR